MRRRLKGIVLLSLLTIIFTSCEENNKGSETLSIISINGDGSRSEVVLPNASSLKADYTRVEGIYVEPGARLAVVAMNLNSGYWAFVEEGSSQAIKDINEYLSYTGDEKIQITFEGSDGNYDIDAQINRIDAVLAENPVALCLAAIDRESCQAQLETAKDSGIPVVLLDSGVESDLAVSACITDNQSAGAEAAKKLCEAVGEDGKILLAAHVQSTDTSAKRVEGFSEELEKHHPQVVLTKVIYETEEEPMENMLFDALTKDPDIKGIFCTNEQMAECALGALEKLDRDDLQIVGFDAGARQLQAIIDGKEYGTVCQNPYGMGYASVIAAFRAAAHQTVDSSIDPGFQWIDRENIELEGNQKYLYW